MEEAALFQAERAGLIERVFNIQSDVEVESLQLDVFRFQNRYNLVYRSWCNLLHKTPENTLHASEIPHLPLALFRQHQIQTGELRYEKVFRSSGTTNQQTSQHFVFDLSIYRQSALQAFRQFFGKPSDHIIIGLLPSYLERTDSSLVYMCEMLMEESGNPENGFYLNQYSDLKALLEKLKESRKKVWLIGVSFALLDFSGYAPPVWQELTVVETGGMKGRRKELVREELHATIKQSWPLSRLYSEYGMTELFSQAYAGEDGWFEPPAWMKIRVREPHDPFSFRQYGQSGGINVTDLANIDSCAFIATEDMGRVDEHGRFTVEGRFDHAIQRGCNLLLL